MEDSMYHKVKIGTNEIGVKLGDSHVTQILA